MVTDDDRHEAAWFAAEDRPDARLKVELLAHAPGFGHGAGFQGSGVQRLSRLLNERVPHRREAGGGAVGLRLVMTVSEELAGSASFGRHEPERAGREVRTEEGGERLV